MNVLVAYDVSTSDSGGEKRLRRVAKVCVEHGQRVQNSLFECSLEPAQFERMKGRLLNEIDSSSDSLRFYNLGKNMKNRVEEYGAKHAYDPEGFLCIFWQSHPAWMRGLKRHSHDQCDEQDDVASRVDAWVETSAITRTTSSSWVASRVDAWVETPTGAYSAS